MFKRYLKTIIDTFIKNRAVMFLSCYIRHMKDFLGDLDIKPENKEERKEVDLAIREAIGKKSTDKCNEVWKEVKIWLNDNEKKEQLASNLKKS